MLNRAIEIHDSILASYSISQGRAELIFSSVYVQQSKGEPALDAGSVWIQKANLRIDDAQVHGEFTEFPVELGGGQTQIGANYSDNLIPVPLYYKGAFELRLQAMWQGQTVVSFTGSGAELELLDEPEYLEEFRPS